MVPSFHHLSAAQHISPHGVWIQAPQFDEWGPDVPADSRWPCVASRLVFAGRCIAHSVFSVSGSVSPLLLVCTNHKAASRACQADCLPSKFLVVFCPGLKHDTLSLIALQLGRTAEWLFKQRQCPIWVRPSLPQTTTVPVGPISRRFLMSRCSRALMPL